MTTAAPSTTGGASSSARLALVRREPRPVCAPTACATLVSTTRTSSVRLPRAPAAVPPSAPLVRIMYSHTQSNAYCRPAYPSLPVRSPPSKSALCPVLSRRAVCPVPTSLLDHGASYAQHTLSGLHRSHLFHPYCSPPANALAVHQIPCSPRQRLSSTSPVSPRIAANSGAFVRRRACDPGYLRLVPGGPSPVRPRPNLCLTAHHFSPGLRSRHTPARKLRPDACCEQSQTPPAFALRSYDFENRLKTVHFIAFPTGLTLPPPSLSICDSLRLPALNSATRYYECERPRAMCGHAPRCRTQRLPPDLYAVRDKVVRISITFHPSAY